MKPVYARLAVVIIIVAVLVLWMAVVEIAADPGTGIGKHWLELFLLQVVISYVAVLSCYVIWGYRSWRRRLARVVLNVAAICVAVLLVELPAALGVFDYRVLLVPKMAGGPGPHNLQLDRELIGRRPAYDHFIERQPGDCAVGLAIPTDRRYVAEYRYDRNGFRNSCDLERAAVVLIGDSFIEGYKVPQEETCSARLSRILAADVANLGQCDYGPTRELIVLRRFGLNLRPRVVVWFFFEGNDLFETEDYEEAMRDWQGYVNRVNGYRNRSFFANALDLVAFWLDQLRWRESDLARRRAGRPLPRTPGEDVTIYFGKPPCEVALHELALLEKVQEILLDAKSTCAANGIELLVANVPTKLRVYQDLCTFPKDSEVPGWKLNDVPKRLGRWCETADIEYVDLTAALKSAAREGTLVYLVDDPHWSAQGHALVAEEIAESIRKAGWLESPEVTKQPGGSPRRGDREGAEVGHE